MKKNKFKKGINDLASQRPDLLLEWDYENNVGLSPYEITIGHSRPAVKWICSKCNHRWAATVANRVGHNSGCPECSKEVIAAKARERRFDSAKSLCSLYPDIAKEWHPTLNGELSVEKAMSGSNDVVWWKCSVCDYSYQAMIINRTGYKHSGCPQCNRYMHTSFPEQAFFYYIKNYFNDAQNGYTDFFDNNMELDIYIPTLRIGVEYDGGHWHHEANKHRNRKKYDLCKENGIKLVRIKENYKHGDYDLLDADINIIRTNKTDDGLKECILKLLNELLPNKEHDVDIMRDRGNIRANYITTFKEYSLLARFPKIAQEWHPTLNGTLKADMVFPSMHEKVWWLCSKCGQPYLASPAHKTRKEHFRGCPICAGKQIVAGINDLASKRPDLAIDWHPTLNGELKPTDIAPNYSKKVWWKCHICSNEFYCTPNKRITRNQGCSECKKAMRATKSE